jgi:hypothetical protein
MTPVVACQARGSIVRRVVRTEAEHKIQAMHDLTTLGEAGHLPLSAREHCILTVAELRSVLIVPPNANG